MALSVDAVRRARQGGTGRRAPTTTSSLRDALPRRRLRRIDTSVKRRIVRAHADARACVCECV
jgi:hypothetical protein